MNGMLSFKKQFKLKRCSGIIEVVYTNESLIQARVHLDCLSVLKGNPLNPFEQGGGRTVPTNNYLAPIDDLINAAARLADEVRLFDLVSSTQGKGGVKVSFWVCANVLASIFHQNGNKVFLLETFEVPQMPGSNDSRQMLNTRAQSDLVDVIKELASFAQEMKSLLLDGVATGSSIQNKSITSLPSAGSGSVHRINDPKRSSKRHSKNQTDPLNTLPVWPVKVSNAIPVE